MNRYLRFDLDFLIRHLPDFAPAVATALTVLAGALAVACVIGIALAMARLARGPIAWIAVAYLELFRNTPLLVQLYFVFFGLPIAGVVLSPFLSGVVALGLQHGAFFGEVLRGTIEAVQPSQREGGLALGLLPGQVMRKIVFPQAIRTAVPAIGNQLVLLLHDTSLVSMIGIYEITLQGRTVAERSAASFEMFVAVGGIYLALSAAFSLATRGVELAVRHAR
jgi:His/Glu/Gln/Arg/opine family amino acid ABC transporter permease subunit